MAIVPFLRASARITKRLFISTFAVSVAMTVAIPFFLSGIPTADAEPAYDKVMLALSTRHVSATPADLERLAGGESELVARLLSYRRLESPPFVGIRSARLLLNYAHRAEVASALADDLQSLHYRGLARIIAVHLDDVPDVEARRKLARLVVARAKQEPDFVPYARGLRSSSDAELQRLAQEAL